MSTPSTDTTKTPSYYSNELEDLKQRFKLILTSGENSVPKSKTYPTDQSYKDSATTYNTNLASYKSDIFSLKNNIENDMKKLEETSQGNASIISDLEIKNKNLNDKLTDLHQTNNGTKGLFKDSRLLYNQYLLGNIYIFASIIITSYYIIYCRESRK